MKQKNTQAPADQAIELADIERFLASTSDFAFEMAVRNRLADAKFSYSYSATYRDPITEKIRSYDFRAHRQVGEKAMFRLAVECKNLRPSSPLLVDRTAREDDEAFHTLLHRQFHGSNIPSYSETRQTGSHSAYPARGMTGRSTDQPMKAQGKAEGSDDEFRRSDAESFEKWLQALHGTRDLLEASVAHPDRSISHTAIVPLLVVPDHRLWQVDYSSDSTQASTPREVSQATLHVKHSWAVPAILNTQVTYTISHIEITTLTGLIPRLRELVQDLFLGI